MVVQDATKRIAWAVVTGGNVGLGREIAERLILKGYHVIIGCRSAIAGDVITKQIKRKLGSNGHVEWMELDLANLSIVNSFATKIKTRRLALRLLVNNAGVLAPEKGSKSYDSLDTSFSVNYAGPFFLTHLLMPELLKFGGLVINVVCEEYAKAGPMDVGFLLNQAEHADRQGLLKITVESASNLRSLGGAALPNPHVLVSIGDSEPFRTLTKRRTANPTFNETFSLRTSETPEKIELEVFDVDVMGDRKSLGKAQVHLSGLTGNVDSLDSNLRASVRLQDDTSTKYNLNVSKKIQDLLEAIKEGRKTGRFAGLQIANLEDVRAIALGRTEVSVAQYKDKAEGHAIIDLHHNTISWRVMKRSNVFKTSVRLITVDLRKRHLRNETIHGRVRKAFPFLQLLGTKYFPDSDTKLSLQFVKENHESNDGSIKVVGGQRDYVLDFESSEQRQVFAEIISPFLWATPMLDGSKIQFNVNKKLNQFNTSMRILVLDLGSRRLHNMEPEFIKQEQVAADPEALKRFDFSQITHLEADKQRPTFINIKFVGGQRPYSVEFLNDEQKQQFVQILEPFIVRRVEGTVSVKVVYTRPPATKTNRFAHRVQRSALVPSADKQPRRWMTESQIKVPLTPNWNFRNWDTAVKSFTPALSPLAATRQSKLFLVSFTMEMARRLNMIRSSVRCHAFDPGLMNTKLHRKAHGLGWVKGLPSQKSWRSWKARRIGTPPDKPAEALVNLLNSVSLSEHNGLYIKYIGSEVFKSATSIVNLSEDKTRVLDVKEANHPTPEAVDIPGSKLLYELTSQMLDVDWEHPQFAAFQALQTL